ncbi:MAG: GCG_CRPN prefix-to-repeats domain-containing protein [Methylocella sp.]
MLAKLFAVAAGCTFAAISFDAGAVPASLFPLEPQSFITQVAGGCGLGWHRGPYGGCRRNWGAWRRCFFRRTPWGPRRVCRW